MTFIFKIIFYLFAIIFIIDKCGAGNEESSFSNRSNKMETKRPYWDHLYPNKIQITLDFSPKDSDHLETKDMLSNFSEEDNGDRSNISAAANSFGIDNIYAVWGKVVSHPDGVVNPKEAKCAPEQVREVTVVDKDLNNFYFPPCMMVERCGGCCSDPKYGCVVTKQEYFSITVHKFNFPPGELIFKDLGKQSIEMTRDLQCKCRCIIHEKGCLPYLED